jgi:hypothetical protein
MEPNGPTSEIEGEHDTPYCFLRVVTFRSISTYVLSPACPLIVISVHLFATTEKPVESRRFDSIGERKLVQQMPDIRPLYSRTGKRRALIVRDKKSGTVD